jgi:uncharacterized protein (DUF924 family)
MTVAALRAPGEILDFWFSERVRPLWFEKDPAFDDEIRRRFGASLEAAAGGALDAWAETPESCLALVVLLDQFARNIHRGTPRAFAGDARARAAAGRAVERGFDRRVPPGWRMFFYLPFEHSEDRADQARSVALFRRLAEEQDGTARDGAIEQIQYALRHQEIIERFGRFPHRNLVLGRDSTPDELAFLDEPDSSF